MTEELRTQMDKLREIAPRLNRASDNGTRTVERLTEFLNGLGIGIPGQGDVFNRTALMPNEDDDIGRYPGVRRYQEWRLTYDRLPGVREFSIDIVIQTYRLDIDFGGVDQPGDLIEERTLMFGQASRSARLKACATLPSLVADIFKAADSQAQEAEEATATIHDTMNTLGIGPNVFTATLANRKGLKVPCVDMAKGVRLD